jgi:hypothetical protein
VAGTAIRAPTDDLKNHTTVLRQLKETTETAQRLRGNPDASFVTVGELVSAGIIKYISGVISPSNNVQTGVGAIQVLDSITGDGSTLAPLKLDGDVASPGISMVYGTSSTGVKGWYAASGGGGGGGVSSVGVVSSTLHVTGSPITSSGTIDVELNPSGVTAAAYTNMNATVDAYGRIVAASNGTGGGGSVPVHTKGDLYGFSTVGARVPVGTDGQVLTADHTQTTGVKWATPTSGGAGGVGGQITRGGTYVSGSGAVMAPGNDIFFLIDQTMVLERVTILTTGGTGSCVVDLRKTPVGSFPPTGANSICGGTLPTITAGTTYDDSTLTGFTILMQQGDVFGIHLSSSSVFTSVMVQLSFVGGGTLTRGATFVNGGSAITLPSGDVMLFFDQAMTLRRVTLLTTGGTGSCQVDLRKVPLASFPPLAGNSICGGLPPTITSGVAHDDSTLAGFTTAFAAGDVLAIHLNSSSTFVSINVQLSFS